MPNPPPGARRQSQFVHQSVIGIGCAVRQRQHRISHQPFGDEYSQDAALTVQVEPKKLVGFLPNQPRFCDMPQPFMVKAPHLRQRSGVEKAADKWLISQSPGLTGEQTGAQESVRNGGNRVVHSITSA